MRLGLPGRSHIVSGLGNLNIFNSGSTVESPTGFQPAIFRLDGCLETLGYIRITNQLYYRRRENATKNRDRSWAPLLIYGGAPFCRHPIDNPAIDIPGRDDVLDIRPKE